jgi:hypothetical protein
MKLKSTLFTAALAGLIAFPFIAPVSRSDTAQPDPAGYLSAVGSLDRSSVSLAPPMTPGRGYRGIADSACGPWLTCGTGTTCCPNDGTQAWQCVPPGGACPGK